ncbi:MAG: hypothetical protein V7K27_18125 [Nostoc sp.]
MKNNKASVVKEEVLKEATSCSHLLLIPINQFPIHDRNPPLWKLYFSVS